MPIEWVFIEIFVIVVEVSVLFYLLHNKFAAKYLTFIPALLFLLINIIILALPKFFDLRNLLIAETFLPIICFVYLLFFRNGSVLKKIFWTLISFAILFSIAFFAITTVAIISGVNSAEAITPNSNELLLTMIIAKTLQIVIFYILAKKKKELTVKLSPIPLIVCFAVPFMSIILTYFIYDLIHKYTDIPDELIFAVAIGYLIINIIVFVLYEYINREAEKNYILIAQNKQYELTREHNEQMVEIYNKMREWRHEYANHMQLVAGILEESKSCGNISEAISYIKNLDEKIQSLSSEIVTGNKIVDAIVSAKATLASSHNITFEHNIILAGDISMDITDLCSILSNLLDNAIEACCKLSRKRYINLEMTTIKMQFNITVENSSDGEYKIENGIFRTTKRGDFHGIGLRYVKSIVENYGGVYKINPEAESFIAQVSIPMASEATK